MLSYNLASVQAVTVTTVVLRGSGTGARVKVTVPLVQPGAALTLAKAVRFAALAAAADILPAAIFAGATWMAAPLERLSVTEGTTTRPSDFLLSSRKPFTRA